MRHLSINKYSPAALIMSLFIVAQGLGQACMAQQTTAAGQRPAIAKPANTLDLIKVPRKPEPHPEKKIVDVFGKAEMLTADKVVFDDLPKYTGKAKFVTGQLFHNSDIRHTTMMMVSYSATEDLDQVKDWYLNAFRMYGWNINSNSESVIGATNTKTSNTCNIQFCKTPGSKTSRCEFQIDYCQYPNP